MEFPQLSLQNIKSKTNEEETGFALSMPELGVKNDSDLVAGVPDL